MLCKYRCKVIYQIIIRATLHRSFPKLGITLKYGIYLRLYLKKQFKVKKAYFMTTEVDLIGEK